MRRRGVVLIRIFVYFYMKEFAGFDALKYVFFFIFFYLRRCPGQLACTTTNPTAH